jgi:hypothetical protein
MGKSMWKDTREARHSGRKLGLAGTRVFDEKSTHGDIVHSTYPVVL